MQNFISLHDLEVAKCEFLRCDTHTYAHIYIQCDSYSEVPPVALAKNALNNKWSFFPYTLILHFTQKIHFVLKWHFHLKMHFH